MTVLVVSPLSRSVRAHTHTMAVHSFWIFDRHTHCIFHREYNHGVGKTPQDALYPGKINTLNDSNESKLLYGMLHSLRNIANELTIDKDEDAKPDEFDFGNSLQLNNNNKVYMINTLNYKMQILETVSGLKMVALTDVGHRNLQSQLQGVYTGVYVPLVVDNGMAPVELDGSAQEVLCPLLRGDVKTLAVHVTHHRRDARFVSRVDSLLI